MISLLYTNVPKLMIIGYIVLEMRRMADAIAAFHLGQFFALLPPNCRKNENFKKWKKQLEISSFYTIVPNIMIIGHTVPEIWCMMGVTVIFHFELFFALLPLWHPKKWKFQKIEKKIWRYHHFTLLHQKSWSHAVLFLRYGMWHM